MRDPNDLSEFVEPLRQLCERMERFTKATGIAPATIRRWIEQLRSVISKMREQ